METIYREVKELKVEFDKERTKWVQWREDKGTLDLWIHFKETKLDLCLNRIRMVRLKDFLSHEWRFRDREHLGYHPKKKGQATLDFFKKLTEQFGEPIEFCVSMTGWTNSREGIYVFPNGGIVIVFGESAFDRTSNVFDYKYSIEIPKDIKIPDILIEKPGLEEGLDYG